MLPHPLFSVHLTKHHVELPHCWRPKPVQKPLQVWFVLAGLRSDMPGKGKERKWVDQQLSSPPEKACVKPMRKRVYFFSQLWACNTELGPSGSNNLAQAAARWIWTRLPAPLRERCMECGHPRSEEQIGNMPCMSAPWSQAICSLNSDEHQKQVLKRTLGPCGGYKAWWL